MSFIRNIGQFFSRAKLLGILVTLTACAAVYTPLAYAGDEATATVYSYDFESGLSGWVIDPGGTDNATTGVWEVGDPNQTDNQNGTTTSGASALITQAINPGGVAGDGDVDGGITTARSPSIVIPATAKTAELVFQYYFEITALGDNLNITVNDSGGVTQLANIAFPTDFTVPPGYREVTLDLTPFLGETITVDFAVDGSFGGLTESSIDDLRVDVVFAVEAEIDITNNADLDSFFTAFEYMPAGTTTVNFQAEIRNISATDDLVINSLNDDVYGNLAALSPACSALIGSTVPAGASATCLFPGSVSLPAAGTSQQNTVSFGLSQSGLTTTIIDASTVGVLGANAGPLINDIFFVPYPEDQVLDSLTAIRGGGAGICSDGSAEPIDPITTLIGLTILSSNTVIYYDHQEDGFEPVLENPVQSTTLVWGDGDLTNGIAPGFATDIIPAGSEIVLRNDVVSTTLQSVIDFDGGDKIAGTFPIAATRAAWANGSETLLAGALEMYNINEQWGTNYVFPVGEDFNNNEVYEYVGASITAQTDGTLVSVDLNNDGDFTDPGEADNKLINEGESVAINGGIQLGGTVTATEDVRVDMITGDICASYEARFLTLFPRETWSTNYYNPVTSTAGSANSVVTLYNPGATAITVSRDIADGAGGITTTTISVPAGGIADDQMPDDSGARYYTTGATPEQFYAVVAVDQSNNAADSQTNDWGITLVPEQFLSTQVLVGTGIGRDPNSTVNPAENGSPIWVTVAKTDQDLAVNGGIDICIDFNGDGGPLTDPNTTRTYDTAIQLEVFESDRIFDPDGDQSGMLLFICDDDLLDQREGVITAAWGQDPATASVGQPGLDAGTGIPNLRAILVSKRSAYTQDLNNDGDANVGDIISYQIDVTNTGLVPIATTQINFGDALPLAYVSYIPNTTTLTSFDTGAPVTIVIPDDLPPRTVFPIDREPGEPDFSVPVEIAIGETVTFEFETLVFAVPFAPDEVCNNSDGVVFNENDSDEECVDVSVNTSTISGFVREDTTGDGLGDTAIPNAFIQLVSDPLGTGDPNDGTVQRIVQTDANGFYEFLDLQAGDYIVIEVDPATYTSVSDLDESPANDIDTVPNNNNNDNLIPVSVVQAENAGGPVIPESNDTQNNFVDVRLASVSGQVWLDEDQDGINDIEEAGLTGVAVELQDGICTPGVDCPVLITDQNGFYTFPDLFPGSYTLDVIDASLPGGVSPTAGQFGALTRPVTLAPGDQLTMQDFGYIADPATGIIGDRVWSDADGDGIQDLGEAGIAGVGLLLLNDPGADGLFGTADDGPPVAGVLTNADGDYLFTGVPFGDYVVVIDPAGTAPGAPLDGFSATTGPQSEGGLIADPVTLNAALSVITDVDFGFDSPATLSIQDRVWYDADGSQTQDPGEPGIEGVTVDLLNAVGAIVASTTTDNLGDFRFDGVPEGDDYRIVVSDREGVLAPLDETTTTNGTALITGSLAAAAAAGDPTLVDTIGDDGTVTFGYNNPGSIAGTIFSDADNSAFQNGGEPGFGGVVVSLTPPADIDLGNGPGVAVTTTTAPDGSYLFDGLPPGDYVLDVPSATRPSGLNTVDPDSIPGDNNAPVSLGIGEGIVGQDFGYLDNGRSDLSGTVFLDTDKDGVEETDGADGVAGNADDEPGFQGVTLDLIDCGTGTCNDGDEAVIASTTTDALGNYVFPGLEDGNYQVAVTDDVALLSGYDITSGLDMLEATIAGADVTDVDFGYIKDEATGSIRGEIFLDENNDGDADATETNYGGVDVFLCTTPIAGGVCTAASPELVAQTVTDASGEYAFTGLPAGNYAVGSDPADVPGGLDNTVIPAPVSLSEGENVDEVDIGYVPAAGNGLISGETWVDANDNGVYDAGEAPLAGVTISVFDPNSATPLVPIATVDSADDGTWSVALSGPTLVDDLIVQYDPADVEAYPNDLESAQPSNLPDGTTDYQGDDVDVASDADNFIGNLNFGFPPDPGTDLGSIAGTIYSDSDQNGDYLPATDGEFAGVTIDLIDDATGTVIATVVTDENGAYSFTGLQDGSYSIVVTDLGNVLQDVNVNEVITLPVTITGGADITDQDQGYVTETTATLASIGSLIFIDINENGFADDGEPRVPGVTVQCWLDNDLSATPNDPGTPVAAPDPEAGVDNLVRTAITDENGEYYCTNLPAGQYIVNVSDVNGVLAGYTDTSPNNAANSPADNFAKPFTYAVTTAAGTPNLAADFGVVAPSSISGTVYFDDNADGGFQPPAGGTDSPLGGIEVEACDQNDVCITVFTEPDGSYTIPVGPGDWTVTVITPPDGTVPLEIPTPNPITVNPGDDVTDIDFGFIDAGSERVGIIRGTVEEDTTGDDLGDTPIQDAIVQLYTDPNGDGDPSDGELVASTTTDANGDYEFTQVPAGGVDYVLVEVDPADYASVSDTQSVDVPADNVDNTVTGTNDNLIPLTLEVNEIDADNDFVDVLPGSIAGAVWFDEDQDGISDIEEAGLTGILVELSDGVCTPLPSPTADCPTTTTDQNGNYQFDNLPAGNYTVNIVDSSLPAGFNPTAGPFGTGGLEPRPVTLVAGDTVEDVDFGYIVAPNTGAIGDRVWSDANGNGVQDPGEAGIEGVTLTLTQVDAAGNSTVIGAPITTGSDGDYLFTNVPYGEDYVVTIAPADAELAGYSPTQGPQSEGGYDGHPVTLSSALTSVTDVDFGFNNPAANNSLSDTVWFDENGDGIFDADEAPIPGVTVNLYLDSDGNGIPDLDANGQPQVIATATTDENGNVSFTGLEDGTYVVGVTDTNSELNGLNGTTDSANTTFSAPVAISGGASSDLDSFGYNNPGLISGTVYSDPDSSSTLDPGESGIGGQTVTLTGDTDGDGTTDITLVTTTAADGSYSFDGLPAGDYLVVVDPPAGTQTEDPDATVDDETPITLAIGASSVENDFGYVDPTLNDISGTVFIDTDKDGKEELDGNDGIAGNADDEPGFAGITLELIDSNGVVIATTTTDVDGNYTFPGLPDGDYEVAVSDESALLAGYDITSGLDTIPVTLNGADETDVDFGYIKDEATGSISGEVFVDESAINGLADDEETNLSGITMYLCLADDAPCTAVNAIATTVTDSDGEYVFTDLPAGEYSVDADPATVPNALTLTVDPAPIALSEGENVTDVDVGYEPDAGTGVLSGFVWTDVDSDGVYDPGEAPIGGLDIFVYANAGGLNLITNGTATTNPDGTWIITGISGADLRDNLLVTYDDAGVPAALESSQPTNLPIGDDLYNPVDLLSDDDNNISFLDFAFPPVAGNNLGSIAGTIYSDADQDSAYDPATDGELAGVTLSLVNSAGVVIATTTTDANGNYIFSGLPDDPVGYSVVVTDKNNELGDLNPLQTISNPIPIVGGADVLDQDAGYAPDTSFGSVGNRFWFDTNSNGVVDDNEPGVEGITVQCWLDADASETPDAPGGVTGAPEPGVDNLIRTVVTDANGEYYCSSLPAGQYIVTVSDSLNFVEATDGTTIPGGAGDGNAKPWTYALTVADGTPNLAADFGVTGSNSLSGKIFIEDINLVEPNLDGTVAGGAGPIPTGNTTVELDGSTSTSTTPGNPLDVSPDAPAVGVTIVLLLEQPDGSFNEVQSTVTDVNGEYSFGGLPDGNYRVEVVPSGSPIDGFGQTGDPDLTAGSNGNGDEDLVCDSPTAAACDDATVVTLNGGPAVTDVNFGYQKNFVTTPVTVNAFTAIGNGSNVVFTWETSNEVGHVGYQIFARSADDWVLLNQDLIVTTDGGDALATRSYTYVAADTGAEWFALVDVSAAEELTKHGPYRLNQAYGEAVNEPTDFDWNTIELSAPSKADIEQSVNSRIDSIRNLGSDEPDDYYGEDDEDETSDAQSALEGEL